MVHVLLLMYCFQASLPLSLPPPVSFSPPKAPPISAPLGPKWKDKKILECISVNHYNILRIKRYARDLPILTLTIPQSLPFGPVHLNAFLTLAEKRDEERPKP
jgi:hypothetical protein